MLARTLAPLALTAFVTAAAAAPALAGSCCGGCAYTCAPPAQIQIWGLSPVYVVNQGPVLSGPGFYASPTYQGEVSTADYPYVGNRLSHQYWQGAPPARPHHFEALHRREASMLYRHSFDR